MQRRARRVAAATATLAVLLSGCAGDRDERAQPRLAGGPLWGMGRNENLEAESITVHEDTVLIARYTGAQWALDAITASSGRRRWTYRIRSFRAPGFGDGRAETGPVIVGAGPNSLALIKDFSMCDHLGNCAGSWLRYGLTALRIADGTVAWSTMTAEPAGGLQQGRPRRHVDTRLVGATDSVAVTSVLFGSWPQASPGQSATNQSPAHQPPADQASADQYSPGLVGFDVCSGDRLWAKPGLRGVLVARDTVIANEVSGLDERGAPRYTGTIVAVDARTGAERWRSTSKLVATEGSDDLVLAMDPASTDSPNLTWTLLSASSGRVRRDGERLGECRAAPALVACVEDAKLTVVTGADAVERTRKFSSIGPSIGTPVDDDVIALVADYERGALTGSYAVDADADVWQGELPGRPIALSDRYAVLDVSYTDTWSDRIAVYAVAR